MQSELSPMLEGMMELLAMPTPALPAPAAQPPTADHFYQLTSALQATTRELNRLSGLLELVHANIKPAL